MKVISSEGLPGVSRSPESGVLPQVRMLKFYSFRTSQLWGESLPAPASPSIRSAVLVQVGLMAGFWG